MARTLQHATKVTARFGWQAVVLFALVCEQLVVARSAWAATPAGDNQWVMAMEVTQATQTWLAVNDHNSPEPNPEISASDQMVPLVQGKRTVVRVYAGVIDNTREITPAQATLTCLDVDATPCPGPAVLAPASPIQIEAGYRNDLNALRGDEARTWNFVLPEVWTEMATPISLTSVISPAQATGSLTVGGLVFHATAPLELHIVYGCVRRHAADPHDKCDHLPLDTHLDLFGEDSFAVRTYPVADQDFHVSLNDPITIPVDGDFNLADGAMSPTRLEAFWRQVCALAHSTKDGAPLPLNVIYVGLLPGPTMEVGGYGGRNCVVVARLDGPGVQRNMLTRQELAHEVGHALGRPHAGCGDHGEPPPCEPAPQVFPCLGSGICTYGFDTAAMRVINPGSPNGFHAYDFMSYGRGLQWVSPYTYRHLYDALRQALPQDPVAAVSATVAAPNHAQSPQSVSALLPRADVPSPATVPSLPAAATTLPVIAVVMAIALIAVTDHTVDLML